MNNVVGKISLVLIFFFSLLGVCFALANYAVAGRWKVAYETSSEQLKSTQTQLSEMSSNRDRETKALEAQLAVVTADRDTFKTEMETAKREAATKDKLLADTQRERDKALADGEVASREAAARVAETDDLANELANLRDKIASLNAELQNRDDSLLDISNQLKAAEDKEESYLTSIARLESAMLAGGLDPDAIVNVGPVSKPKEKVDGFVSETVMNENNTQQLIEITLGSDDTISDGMELTVYRDKNFLCKAEVIKLFADTAHCLVLEKTRDGRRPMKGDNVTTKL